MHRVGRGGTPSVEKRRAVDRRSAFTSAGRPAQRLVGGLRRAVGPVDAGLPAGEVVLVDQVEVEVGADERLAVGDLDRVGELHRLVEPGPRALVGRLRSATSAGSGLASVSVPVYAPTCAGSGTVW